jgi:hypothetical protein
MPFRGHARIIGEHELARRAALMIPIPRRRYEHVNMLRNGCVRIAAGPDRAKFILIWSAFQANGSDMGSQKKTK